MAQKEKDPGSLFPFTAYAMQDPAAIAAAFESSLTTGLASATVTAHLKKFGLNQPHEKTVHWWDILFHQITSLFFILFCALGILFIILGQWSDAVIVFLLIGINLSVACYQEYKASRTIKLLHSYIKKMAKVMRNGKRETIEVSQLVPGDIVYLKKGDIVPADLRIIEEKDLVIDESVLTGESAPVKKRAAADQPITDLFNAFTIAFAGTIVDQGSARGIVFATGNGSLFGSLVKSSGYSGWHQSTIEKSVVELSTFIVILTVITLAVIFVAHILIKGFAHTDFLHLLLFFTALMVSIIPEALPMVVIFNLSLGVRRLISMDLIVKRLSALEDLGAVNLLCIDKTGTLTERQLSLAQVIGPDEKSLLAYAAASLLPEMTNKAGFEGAIETYIMAHARQLITEIPATYQYIESIPFDPVHRRTMVLVSEKKTDTAIAIVRGSFENIAALCHEIPPDLKQMAYDEGVKGNRVLGLAIKKSAAKPKRLADEQTDYTLLGMLSFTDPIKKTAPQVIKRAQELGIALKVISGDAPEVCAAIGLQLKLIDNPNQVITGDTLEKASSSEKLRLVREHTIFARILPDQKAAIIALMKQNSTVGYMGDGLNDLPALEMADVALVVQGCPDVVREAGDIILQQQSLLAVVRGINEGRVVLANTMKYIKTVLATNFGNFYTIAICSLLLNYVPLLPIQILLLNFMSDFPMITIGTDNLDEEEIGQPQRYSIKGILAITIILGIVSSIFDFIFFSYFMRQSADLLRSSWFLENIFTQMAFIFSIRTKKLFFKARRPSYALIIAALSMILIGIVLVYTPFGQHLFSFIAVDWFSLLLVLIVSIAYGITTELVKYGYYQIMG